MMILMLELLVVPGSGGPMGMHGANEAPSQASQPLERDAVKADSGER